MFVFEYSTTTLQIQGLIDYKFLIQEVKNTRDLRSFEIRFKFESAVRFDSKRIIGPIRR